MKRTAILALGLFILLAYEPAEAQPGAYSEALEHCAILADDEVRKARCQAPSCDAAEAVEDALRIVEEAGSKAARFLGEERLALESCRIARDVVAAGQLERHGKRALALAYSYVKAATLPELSGEDRATVTKLAGRWAGAVGSLRFNFSAPAGTPPPTEFAWWAFLLLSWDGWNVGEEFYPYSLFFQEMKEEASRIFPDAARFSNPAGARIFLNRLYQEEDPRALHVVGMIHRHHGRLGAAERDLRRSAELGRTNAYFELGLLKTEEHHVARIYFHGWEYDRRTYAWMEEAAEAGHPRAALLVAQELCLLPALKPDYVPVDGARAERYADAAARSGLRDAEEFLKRLAHEGGPDACGSP